MITTLSVHQEASAATIPQVSPPSTQLEQSQRSYLTKDENTNTTQTTTAIKQQAQAPSPSCWGFVNEQPELYQVLKTNIKLNITLTKKVEEFHQLSPRVALVCETLDGSDYVFRNGIEMQKVQLRKNIASFKVLINPITKLKKENIYNDQLPLYPSDRKLKARFWLRFFLGKYSPINTKRFFLFIRRDEQRMHAKKQTGSVVPSTPSPPRFQRTSTPRSTSRNHRSNSNPTTSTKDTTTSSGSPIKVGGIAHSTGFSRVSSVPRKSSLPLFASGVGRGAFQEVTERSFSRSMSPTAMMDFSRNPGDDYHKKERFSGHRHSRRSRSLSLSNGNSNGGVGSSPIVFKPTLLPSGSSRTSSPSPLNSFDSPVLSLKQDVKDSILACQRILSKFSCSLPSDRHSPSLPLYRFNSLEERSFRVDWLERFEGRMVVFVGDHDLKLFSENGSFFGCDEHEESHADVVMASGSNFEPEDNNSTGGIVDQRNNNIESYCGFVEKQSFIFGVESDSSSQDSVGLYKKAQCDLIKDGELPLLCSLCIIGKRLDGKEYQINLDSRLPVDLLKIDITNGKVIRIGDSALKIIFCMNDPFQSGDGCVFRLSVKFFKLDKQGKIVQAHDFGSSEGCAESSNCDHSNALKTNWFRGCSLDGLFATREFASLAQSFLHLQQRIQQIGPLEEQKKQVHEQRKQQDVVLGNIDENSVDGCRNEEERKGHLSGVMEDVGYVPPDDRSLSFPRKDLERKEEREIGVPIAMSKEDIEVKKRSSSDENSSPPPPREIKRSNFSCIVQKPHDVQICTQVIKPHVTVRLLREELDKLNFVDGYLEIVLIWKYKDENKKWRTVNVPNGLFYETTKAFFRDTEIIKFKHVHLNNWTSIKNFVRENLPRNNWKDKYLKANYGLRFNLRSSSNNVAVMELPSLFSIDIRRENDPNYINPHKRKNSFTQYPSSNKNKRPKLSMEDLLFAVCFSDDVEGINNSSGSDVANLNNGEDQDLSDSKNSSSANREDDNHSKMEF